MSTLAKSITPKEPQSSKTDMEPDVNDLRCTEGPFVRNLLGYQMTFIVSSDLLTSACWCYQYEPMFIAITWNSLPDCGNAFIRDNDGCYACLTYLDDPQQPPLSPLDFCSYIPWDVINRIHNGNPKFYVDARCMQTPTPTSTNTPVPTSTPTYTPVPTDTPTPTPTDIPTRVPTVTPTAIPPSPTPSCSTLTMTAADFSFDPDTALPGDQVTIYLDVHNTGGVDVSYTEIRFAYEGTPLDPGDDPNMVWIGDPVPLSNITMGDTATASVVWDTTGLDPITYPVYAMTQNTDPEECDPGYVQTDFMVPVTLASLEAVPHNTAVTVEWTTHTEINNFGFHVYRSTRYFDAYEKITSRLIPGAGTSFEPHEYQFEDTVVQNGMPFFYRLASIDTTGETDWSHTVSAVPHSSSIAVRAAADVNRRVFAPGDPMIMKYRISNTAGTANVRLQMILVFNGEYAGDIVHGAVVRFPEGFDVTGDLFNYTWTGNEPEGHYLIATVLSDPITGELVDLQVAEFTFK